MKISLPASVDEINTQIRRFDIGIDVVGYYAELGHDFAINPGIMFMAIKKSILLLALSFTACTSNQNTKAQTKTSQATPNDRNANVSYEGAILPAQLKEISGMTRDGQYVWAISDAPVPVIYKLTQQGKVVQHTELKNIQVTDMESLTSDESYVYIADIGNNKGKRSSRSVVRVPKALLNGGSTTTTGETIIFNFEDELSGGGNHNCEAMLTHKDSLYFFTKQDDGMTQLYVVPKKVGRWTAKKHGQLDAHGLITGASINHAGTEVALVGYRKGHKRPFVILIDGFRNNHFLTGNTSRYELDNETRDWQVESISYIDDQTLTFACEGTKDVPQTLYTIKRESLVQLPQKEEGSIIKDDSKKDKKGKKDKKKKKEEY